MLSKAGFSSRSEQLYLDKMSVAQLEQFVSFIVKRACSNGVDPNHVIRPKWWPRELAFRYPVERKSTTDIATWREMLLDVVARCYSYRKRDNGSLRTDNTTKRNLRSLNKTRKGTPNKTIVGEDGNETINHIKIPSKEQYSLCPVVSLCDVMKLQDGPKLEQLKPVSKNDFLNYFKLSDTHNCSVILNNNDYKHPSHPIHLINSQQVPFSSNLGIKLTKECHIVPQGIHQRKIERIERYLSTVISTDTTKPVDYEITFNKNKNVSHNYVFPSRQHRKRERLSLKSTLLLMHNCKPCYVSLKNLKINPKQFDINKRIEDSKIIPASNFKENKVQTKSRKKKILNFLNFNGNTHSQNTLQPQKCSPRTNVNNHAIHGNEKKANGILQTLVPTNQNAVGNLPIINSNIVNERQHFLNASVLLTPINGFFRLRNSENYSLFRSTADKKRGKNGNKVQKRRVLIYHPRRYSLRVLQLKHPIDKT